MDRSGSAWPWRGRYSLRNSIQSAREAHVKTPLASRTARRRPSACARPRPSSHERIVCGSPTRTGQPSRAVRRASTIAGPVAQLRHRRARRAVERRPDELGPHAGRRRRRATRRASRSAPNSAVAAGQRRREDAEPVRRAPGPQTKQVGKGWPADQRSRPGLLRGGAPRRPGPASGTSTQQLARRALGDERVAVAHAHPLAVAHHLERRVERRRRAQRHLDHLGADEPRHPPAGVAAVRRGGRPVEAGRDGERVSHARAGTDSSASRRSSTVWKSSPSRWSWR